MPWLDLAEGVLTEFAERFDVQAAISDAINSAQLQTSKYEDGKHYQATYWESVKADPKKMEAVRAGRRESAKKHYRKSVRAPKAADQLRAKNRAAFASYYDRLKADPERWAAHQAKLRKRYEKP